jgi:hypothetical protein
MLSSVPRVPTLTLFTKEDCSLCHEALGKHSIHQSPNFKTFKEVKNRFQGISSASICNLADRYDNPIPTLFLASKDCLKIPAEDILSSPLVIDFI